MRCNTTGDGFEGAASKITNRSSAGPAGPTEPIAIVGMGCRFPGAPNPGAFWRLLCEGRHAITEVPPDRWDVDAYYDARPGIRGKMNTRWGGFLGRIDEFDAQFFGISPREAARMDPQQRLLLEVAWEALEDGGQVIHRLAGTPVGVFIGVSGNDYGRLQMDPSLTDAYMGTGNATSIVANRLSYVFDFRGPSFIVDTACSSSLVAIHLACRSLWNGEATLAVAGGVGVILLPTMTINFTLAGMLSPDGQCKAFDAAANGYVRGEGAGVVVLKQLSQALADGDPIYALIRGSALNQDGRSNGLTVPSQSAQEAVILEACQRAGVAPGDIDYIEAHGTGTPIGDPIEARALGNVLQLDRKPGRHCLLGSVKTNIGHLEAASGVAGLIKVALSLKHRKIPPSLHYRVPNPQIPFEQFPLRVVTTLCGWPQQQKPLAGVNSFGFGGTNVHVVLEGTDDALLTERAEAAPLVRASEASYILPLSARSPEALRSFAQAYLTFPAPTDADSAEMLKDICYTAGVRRTHHDYRLAVVVDSLQQMRESINVLLQGEAKPGLSAGTSKGGSNLVFVFPGQGTQWPGMGRELLLEERVFREAVEECDALYRSFAGWSLLDELIADPERSRLDQTEFAQPAIFTLQVALASLWRSWGVVPAAVVGHSVGEIAAAHVAGILSLRDAMQVVFHRGRLMERAAGCGRMAAVELPRDAAEAALVGYGHRVSIAAANSPTSCTLSGEPPALEEILAALQQRGVFVRLLPVNYAFHSPQMEPFQTELIQALPGLQRQPGEIPVFSTVTGRPANAEDFDAAYWARNMVQPVLFAAATDELIESGHDIFLELSPNPALLGAVSQCIRRRSKEGVAIPSVRRGESERKALLRSFGALYTAGYPVDFGKLYPAAGRCVPLPSYPWQRERHWIEIKPGDPDKGAWRESRQPGSHPLLARHLKAAHPVWEAELERSNPSYLNDHRVQGAVILPGAVYVEMVLTAASQLFGEGYYELTNVEFQKALFLPESGARTVQVILSNAGNQGAVFEIYSRAGDAEASPASWTLHATGRLLPGSSNTSAIRPAPVAIETLRARCREEIRPEDFYVALRERGLEYGHAFQAIAELWRGENEACGQLRLPHKLATGAGSYHLHPAILDSGFQMLACALNGRASDGQMQSLYLPVSIERIHWHGRPGPQSWCHAQLDRFRDGPADAFAGNVRIYDEAGEVLAEVFGLRLQSVVEKPAAREIEGRSDEWLYDVIWEPKPGIGQSSSALPIGDFPSIDEIAGRLRSETVRSTSEHQLNQYAEIAAEIEKLTNAYVVSAFRRFGCDRDQLRNAAIELLAEQWSVPVRHRRLLGRLCERLRELDGEADVLGASASDDPEQLRQSLLTRYPAFQAELTLTGRCGQHFFEVLRGQCDPLQLLFPGGSMETLEQMYRDSPFCRLHNTLVREALGAWLDHWPASRAVRVLEIGAGTGALSSYLIPALQGRQAEYVFTDLSSLFTLHAKKTFQEYPFVRYQLLDIERDPETQGFRRHEFDVIVAANVLHTTAGLRRVLAHVRQLLASEGLLLVLEIAERTGMYDAVFGMTEGWWNFKDLDLRPEHPLLAPNQWLSLLHDSGFSEAAAVPEGVDPLRDPSRQSVIIARGPAVQQELQPSSEVGQQSRQPGNWIIFTDGGAGSQLAEMVRSRGGSCVIVSAGETYRVLGPESYQLNPARPEEFSRLTAELLGREAPRFDGVIHLWSLLNTPTGDENTTLESLQHAHLVSCGSVLHLVQALIPLKGTEQLRLWLVTAGAHALGVEEGAVSIAQSPLHGLSKVIALEYPDLRCTHVDLSCDPTPEEITALEQELGQEDRESQVALRGSARYAQRLVHTSTTVTARPQSIAPPSRQPFRLKMSRPGTLEQMMFHATTRREPGIGEVEIEICAAGLNFRDVALALGLLPVSADNPLLFGMECAGTIVRLGKDAGTFKIGDEVIALAPETFGSHVITPALLVALKPAGFTFEEGAGIPVAFLTAYYSLHCAARLRAGERVLIHAAAGGVGLAAVQVARWLGAEIFATAGSPEKRAFLQAQGVRYVMDSRSSAFLNEVLELTGGEGVDVVLNSLAGDLLMKSLAALRSGGRFIEIGKRDIYQNTKLGLRTLQKNLSFNAIDLLGLSRERPDFTGSLLREVMQHFADGIFKPLRFEAFPISGIVTAFRHMAQAKHIGKIVLNLQDQERLAVQPSQEPIRFHPDATYLITGGLGGFGLLVGQWAIQRGARHLVLVGRHGASTEAAARAVDQMRQPGVEVVVARADIADARQTANVLADIERSLPPLRGVFHAAMVLDDAALPDLDLHRFERVMAPKVNGVWNLHTLTLNKALDHFVLFSSATTVMGFPGQGNYVAANAFLDAFAHYRRRRGLAATAIDWGPLEETGYVAQRKEIGERLDRLGFQGLTSNQALTLLDRVLQLNPVRIIVVRADWERWRHYDPYAGSILSNVAASRGSDASDQNGNSILRKLRTVSPDERKPLLESYLQTLTARTLQLDPARLDKGKPLSSVGLDSLMGLELKTHIESELEVSLPMASLLRGPSLSELAAELLTLLPVASTPTVVKTNDQDSQRKNREELLAELDRLSESEVDALLGNLLEKENQLSEEGKA